jgi:hypothetical protein
MNINLSNAKNIIIFVLSVIIYFLSAKPTEIIKKVPVEVLVETPGIERIIKGDSIPVPYKVEVPYAVENPLNRELEIKYNKANDSIKKLLYMMVIAQKEYNITYTDTIQSVDVYSKIKNGELSDQYIKYNIFPTKRIVSTTVDVKIPTYNEIYFGLEVSRPVISEANSYITGGIIFKNKKNNLLKLSYNTRNEVSFGYYLKL